MRSSVYPWQAAAGAGVRSTGPVARLQAALAAALLLAIPLAGTYFARIDPAAEAPRAAKATTPRAAKAPPPVEPTVDTNQQGDGAGSVNSVLLALIGRLLAGREKTMAEAPVKPSIAREAAMNASGEALDRIAAAEAATHDAGDWDSYEAADDDFHRAISEASDNIPLVAIFDRLNSIRRSVTWGAVHRQTPKPTPDHGSFAEHTAIAKAIADHDPDAAQALMRAHLKAVSHRLFGDF